MSDKISLHEIQKKIHDWITKHGGYWPPLAMLSALIEEVGELAKEINHLEGYKPKRNKNEDVQIGGEDGHGKCRYNLRHPWRWFTGSAPGDDSARNRSRGQEEGRQTLGGH